MSQRADARRLSARRLRRGRPLVEQVESRVLLSTLVVTNTSDSGPGSLRQAIVDSNANPAPAGQSNRIDFEIGPGIQVIRPTSTLPAITSTVTVDPTASQEVGQSVEIQGDLAGEDVSGLTIQGEGVVIDGLSIVQFGGSGVLIDGGGGNVIEGSDLGTETGDSALGYGNVANGVTIVDSSANTIGGSTSAASNVLSGNGLNGIQIVGPDASANIVEGNLIGIDRSGSVLVPNSRDGVFLVSSSANTIGGTNPGARDIIVANGQNGIEIGGAGATGNVVLGSLIGATVNDPSSPTGNLLFAGNLADGIKIDGSNGDASANTIGGTADGAGNLITSNQADGIEIVNVLATPATGEVILGNVIGQDSSSGIFLGSGNAQSGVAIIDSSGTRVGGTTYQAINFIAGNDRDGVDLINGGNNSIQGNYIGCDESGLLNGGNAGDGIFDYAGMDDAVGGPLPGQGNLIFGNGGSGVELLECISDSVQGNVIGLNAAGSLYSDLLNRDGTPQQLGNAEDGVLINGGELVTIGGTGAGALNIISGNLKNGISIVEDSHGDSIQGNYVGLDPTGLAARGNRLDGIYIAASGNYVGTYVDDSGVEHPGGNVVSGNLNSGVVLSTGSANANVVAGNLIGTNALGGVNPDDSPPNIGSDGLPIGNRQDGVFVNDNAVLNTIGGTTAIDRNVISGNGSNGVQILGISVDPDPNAPIPHGDLVIGNFIGTDATGLAADGNAANGIFLYNARANIVGMPGAGNLIAGNLSSGVAIQGESATNNAVMGNLIGTNTQTTTQLGNRGDGVTIVEAADNVVGGSGSGEPNLIQGNGGTGVSISSEADSTIVADDVIAGNSGDGVSIASDSEGCVVVGDRIGVDSSGEVALGNKLDGIRVTDAVPVLTPARLPDPRAQVITNVISANSGAGVEVIGGSSGTVIQGNAIGLDLGGSKPLGNAVGVLVDGVGHLTIGGTGLGAGNLISGNNVGVEVMPPVDTSTPLDDLIAGNTIGLDISGEVAVGNVFGVFLDDALGVTVGGTTPGAGDVISGNSGVGVQVFRVSAGGSGDLIEGNTIGLDRAGLAGPSGDDQPIGVFLNSASNNTVGGTVAGAANVISGNVVGSPNATGYGVLIFGQANAEPVDNVVQGNLIGTNAAGVPLLGSARAPIQDVGVAVNASSGNLIGGVTSSAGNRIEGNLVGVQVAGLVGKLAGIPLGNAIVGNTIDANTFGVFINGASSNAIVSDDISRNTSIGLSILDPQSQANTVTGDTFSGNGSAASGASAGSTVGDGVYIEGAVDNTIVGNSIDSTGLIGKDKQGNGVGVYLFAGASGNKIASNTIRGSSAYGILVYNSASNLGAIPRTGKNANHLGGSGIADFREYTGPVTTTSTTTLASTSKSPRKVAKKK